LDSWKIGPLSWTSRLMVILYLVLSWTLQFDSYLMCSLFLRKLNFCLIWYKKLSSIANCIASAFPSALISFSSTSFLLVSTLFTPSQKRLGRERIEFGKMKTTVTEVVECFWSIVRIETRITNNVVSGDSLREWKALHDSEIMEQAALHWSDWPLLLLFYFFTCPNSSISGFYLFSPSQQASSFHLVFPVHFVFYRFIFK